MKPSKPDMIRFNNNLATVELPEVNYNPASAKLRHANPTMVHEGPVCHCLQRTNTIRQKKHR